MIEALEINVHKAAKSKLSLLNLKNVPFGKYFTDHMLEADFENGEWKNVEIKPYHPLMLDPANAALHYGQAIFEGIKAFRTVDGGISVFRPYENLKRFNFSARRMQMPEVPEDIFIEGLRLLIDIDRKWVPAMEDHSLYIRPFMIATDSVIGVKPSETYKFMIILSPTGPYYGKPLRIYVEENYTRAAPGGIGNAKAAANYGASMLPTAKARELGYDQVLWTDAHEHKWVQEIGTMNVFFKINNTVITPDLAEGTILNGITRDSALVVLKEMGLEVEERPISIDELVEAFNQGTLTEAFGTGTAAVISPIKELRYKNFVMEFDSNLATTAPELKLRLADIKEGKVPDEFGWLFNI